MTSDAGPLAPSYTGHPGNRSLADNGTYVPFVELAARDYQAFLTFKRHPHYQAVLEHVSPELGQAYLRAIAAQSPGLLAGIGTFAINDLVGGAEIVRYGDIALSPSTLRYVKVASDLVTLFGEGLEGGRIAEIGVGYGGQMLVLDQIYRFGQYHLFDLPPVLELTQRYLESHLLRSAYRKFTLNQHDGGESYDLVISNYAFSELPMALQKEYLRKILRKAKRGYLTMNSGRANSIFRTDKMSLEELRASLPASMVIEEQPSSCPGNYILVWGQR